MSTTQRHKTDSDATGRFEGGEVVKYGTLNNRGHSYGEILISEEPSIIQPGHDFVLPVRAVPHVEIVAEGVLIGVDGAGMAHVYVGDGEIEIYDDGEHVDGGELDTTLSAYVEKVEEYRGEWDCVYVPENR